jgi:hypothetical protein
MDGLGYHEHLDGFNSDNIPETILDRAYHILVVSIAGGPINHTHQDTVSQVSLKVFIRGYRDVTEAIDSSILTLETIVKDVCKLSNRTSSVFNVVFDGCDFNPLSNSNDNSVMLDITFSVQVILGIEE